MIRCFSPPFLLCRNPFHSKLSSLSSLSSSSNTTISHLLPHPTGFSSWLNIHLLAQVFHFPISLTSVQAVAPPYPALISKIWEKTEIKTHSSGPGLHTWCWHALRCWQWCGQASACYLGTVSRSKCSIYTLKKKKAAFPKLVTRQNLRHICYEKDIFLIQT